MLDVRTFENISWHDTVKDLAESTALACQPADPTVVPWHAVGGARDAVRVTPLGGAYFMLTTERDCWLGLADAEDMPNGFTRAAAFGLLDYYGFVETDDDIADSLTRVGARFATSISGGAYDHHRVASSALGREARFDTLGAAASRVWAAGYEYRAAVQARDSLIRLTYQAGATPSQIGVICDMSRQAVHKALGRATAAEPK